MIDETDPRVGASHHTAASPVTVRTASEARGYRAVRLVLLFDLDGTLTDPAAGIVRCMRYALDKLGAACPAGDVLASFIGPSLRGTFATLLETSDQELVDEAMACYR